MPRTSTRRPLSAGAALLTAGLLLTGCSVDDGDKSATSVPSDKKLTLGFVNGNTIEFHTCLQKAMQARADRDGVALLTANSAMDPAKELANIDDMIVKKVDAIVVQTVNIDSLEGGINRANRAGIPIFLTSVASVDQSKILGAVVTDVAKVGRDLGAWLAKDSGGEAVDVAVIGGAPGAAADLMNDAFKKSLGAKAKVVFDQPAMWQRAKAQDVAENLLQAKPDVKYVFVHNEDMAFGAQAAFKAAGRADIKILTNGGSEAGVAAVRSGGFAVTVSNTPKDVGEMAVDNVVGLLRKAPDTQKIVFVPETVITSQNASQAPPYCP